MTDAIDRARTVPIRGHCTYPARLREATTQAWHSAMGTSAKPAAAIFDFRDGIGVELEDMQRGIDLGLDGLADGLGKILDLGLLLERKGCG